MSKTEASVISGSNLFNSLRIGQGFDVHAFEQGEALVIGGIKIPFDKSLKGHSDADVLLHAITDAIMGALAMGDIGRRFPDTDSAYRGVNSMSLLEEVWEEAYANRWSIGNCDSVVMAERPKLSPFVPQMQAAISRTLKCLPEQIGIKATTTERLGFVGREEGIAASAVILLVRRPDDQ